MPKRTSIERAEARAQNIERKYKTVAEGRPSRAKPGAGIWRIGRTAAGGWTWARKDKQ